MEKIIACEDEFSRATKLVADIRRAIFDELGFTCSGLEFNLL